MTSPSINKEDFDSAMRSSLKEHWRLFTVQGVLLVILGMIAVAAPQLAAVFTSAFIGWFLFFSGIFRTFSLIRSTRAPGYWSSLLLAVLTAIVGFIMAWYPLDGAVTLTMLLTAYFIVHGIATFILAFSVKGETGRWVLLLISGLIDFLLAGLVIARWPSTALWVLGLFVGINMLLTGFAFIFAALGVRSAEPSERQP
jgi:uncharacterized membrane protein HdeD (DUF308 family)